MKKLFSMSLIILLLINLFPSKEVDAAIHELEDLHIHVEINDDGSALIKEKRVSTLSKGTENYIVVGHLGESTIKDFKVIEDEMIYDYVEDWDVDTTQEEKAFKNSIIKKEDQYELVWGIGKYGKHEYEIEYLVTDFIKQLDDSQMLFWQFVNRDTNIPPLRVTVEIETSEAFTKENESIWAFGFEGDIHFEEGKIIAKNDQPLENENYVTILVELSQGRFHTNDVINQPFEEVKEEAFKGSDYTSEGISGKDILLGLFVLLVMVPIGLMIIVIPIVMFIKNLGEKKIKKKRYENEYRREVPYDGPSQDTYELLNKLNLTRFDYLVASFILKWIHEDRIKYELEEKKGLFRTKEVVTIYLVDTDTDHLSAEEAKLYSFFKVASKNGVVEEERFEAWAKKNEKDISGWEDDMKDYSRAVMEEEGYLDTEESKVFGMPYSVTSLTGAGQQIEADLYKFMNYLQDYSLLNERGPANVKLWDEYMIWAALLGITEGVYDQLKALYPQYEYESSFTPAMLRGINAYSSSVDHAINSSGGASSVGGGGGSFGGGSGGGTR